MSPSWVACGAQGMTCMACQPAEVCSVDGACVPPVSQQTNACGADLSTDANHCGRCGHACGGGACTAGQCAPAVFAQSASAVRSLQVADGALYWSEEGSYVPGVGTGAVKRRPLDGGVPQVLMDRLTKPVMAVGGGRLYATDDVGYVFSCSLSPGCASRAVVLDFTAESGWFDGLAATPTGVYVANRGTTDSSGNWTTELLRCPATGCVPATGLQAPHLYAGSAVSLIAQGETPFWLSLEYSNLVTSTFASTYSSSALVGSPVVGGVALAADATDVYFVTGLTGTFARKNVLGRVPRAGGAPTKLLSDLPTLGGVAVDDSFIYWTEVPSGTLRRMPRAGGAAETLAANLQKPGRVVVTDAEIFFTTADTVIQRLMK